MTDKNVEIDDERYASLRTIAWWDQARLKNARILVVGAGALGNEVLKNLALLGIGRVMVVDFDRVERSNLARSILFRPCDEGQAKSLVAARRMADINSDVTVRPLVGNVITDVGLGRFRQANVVIGCLDNREARLWVNRCCWRVGTPWIEGAIQELDGIVRVFTPPKGACYECGLTEADYRHLQRRYSCPFLLSEEELRAGKVPTTPTIASVVAAWQVQEAVKWLHGLAVPASRAMVFNGLSSQAYTIELPCRSDCLAHETYAPIEELPLTHRARLTDVFDEISARLSTGHLTLQLDRPLVTFRSCDACQLRQRLFVVRATVTDRQGLCPRCGALARLSTVFQIRAQSRLARYTLAELGIPDFDILRIADAHQEHYFQLAPEESW